MGAVLYGIITYKGVYKLPFTKTKIWGLPQM
jgi:hypothetical protein